MDLESVIYEILSREEMNIARLKKELERQGLRTSLLDVVRALSNMEAKRLVERVRSENYSPVRPLMTTLWKARKQSLLPQLSTPEARGVEVEVVVSLPLWRLLEGKHINIIPITDALDAMLESAKDAIYISTPYADATLSTIISRHIEQLSKLHFVRVLIDIDTLSRRREAALLERLKALLPQFEYKVVGEYKTVKAKGMSYHMKTRGLHLKVIAVDQKTALVGSFNLRETHLVANHDLALLVRGYLARILWDILDTLWASLEGGK